MMASRAEGRQQRLRLPACDSFLPSFSHRLFPAAGSTFFHWRRGPTPPRDFADASPRIHSPRLGMAAGAAVIVLSPILRACFLELRGYFGRQPLRRDDAREGAEAENPTLEGSV